MLLRVYRVFLRFCEGRVSLIGKGAEIAGTEQEALASLNHVALSDGRLHLSGTTQSDVLNFEMGWLDLRAEPNGEGCFHLECPPMTGPIRMTAHTGETVTAQGVRPGQLRRARLRQLLPFAVAMVKNLPDIWAWKRKGDMGARQRVKERLGLSPPTRAVEMDAAHIPPAPGQPDRTVPITIILPVFNAYDLLVEALHRIETHTDLPWHLIMVEDCSTDPAVRPMVQNWAADPARADRVTLLLNETNLGFIGAVNRGLDVATRRPAGAVVLFNSDALVPKKWASRLIAPILSDPSVASVTPFSNDAEIFTAPAICHRHTLPAGAVDRIDAAIAQFGNGVADVGAPTGVGFCMALSPDFLLKQPQLDTCFGRGYGEETDWCQRVAAMGGRHVTAANLFVEHAGGTSFGSAAKQKLLERNSAIIRKRYPDYDDAVSNFIASDPLVAPRLAAGLAWADAVQNGQVPVYIAHSMGGGAEHDLQHRLDQDLSTDAAAVVLRVGQGHRWQVELHINHGEDHGRAQCFGLTEDSAFVGMLLSLLSRRRFIYSCGVGAKDPLDLPRMICALASPDDRVEVLFHDFFPISPVYTLVPQGGRYVGPPVDDPNNDHRFRQIDRSWVTLTQWQTVWGQLMARADQAIVFSESSAKIVETVYPNLAAKTDVKPHHRDLPDLTAPHRPRDGRMVIGVLGNIGWHKGAEVVARLSRAMTRDGDSKLVVLGQLDPAYSVAPPSIVHGAYDLTDIPKLAARYGIDGWFMPSVWPETFSFVIHEMIATGLPVTSFDIGAQADAVRAAGGQAIPVVDAGRSPNPTQILEALGLVENT